MTQALPQRPKSGSKPPIPQRPKSGKPSRPSSAAAAKPKVVKPDLIEALKTGGLQQYGRKLEEMGMVGVAQIVKMRRTQIDELIEQLRPLPGHRLRLLNLFEEQRACAAPLEPRTRVRHGRARDTASFGTHTFEPRLGQATRRARCARADRRHARAAAWRCRAATPQL